MYIEQPRVQLTSVMFGLHRFTEHHRSLTNLVIFGT